MSPVPRTISTLQRVTRTKQQQTKKVIPSIKKKMTTVKLASASTPTTTTPLKKPTISTTTTSTTTTTATSCQKFYSPRNKRSDIVVAKQRFQDGVVYKRFCAICILEGRSKSPSQVTQYCEAHDIFLCTEAHHFTHPSPVACNQREWTCWQKFHEHYQGKFQAYNVQGKIIKQGPVYEVLYQKRKNFSIYNTVGSTSSSKMKKNRPQKPEQEHVLGVIGGSSLFHAKEFSSGLQERTIETQYGGVVVHEGMWKNTKMKLVFVQRHHADPDMQYKQPRQINYRAIAAAIQLAKCEAVIGIYSMGSMKMYMPVGKLVIPEDWFNPFDILHISHHYDAHVVPEVNSRLRQEIVKILEEAQFQPNHGGVYVQTAGPRFETKAEVRFFSQFGDLIGMTGANEAELLNELAIPFAMFGIVDNMGNGLGEKLTLEDFKISQKKNADMMERAVCMVLSEFALNPEKIFTPVLSQQS